MNPDTLSVLRDQPLPQVPAALTEQIRGASRARLRAARRRAAARRVVAPSVAAVIVLLCLSNLGFTLTFIDRVQAPATAVSVLR